MSKKTVVTIVLICLAVFIVFGTITNIIIFNKGFREGGFSKAVKGEYFEINESKKIDLTGVKVIDIHVVSSDVNVFDSSDQLGVTLKTSGMSTGEKVKLVIEENGSTVYVKVEHPKQVFSFDISESALDIGLPSDYTGDVIINSVSGDVHNSARLANELSGLDVDTTSGDVNLSVKSIEEFVARSVSGEIDLDTEILKSFRSSTTSGDIQVMSIASGCESVYAKSVSGSVDLEYDVACATEIKTTSGDIRIGLSGNEAIDLRFKATSGDMSGNVNMNDAGVNFAISSTSGNLKFR